MSALMYACANVCPMSECLSKQLQMFYIILGCTKSNTNVFLTSALKNIQLVKLGKKWLFFAKYYKLNLLLMKIQ